MKKVMESQRSGSSKDDIYVPTLWYYDLLLFTRARIFMQMHILLHLTYNNSD